MKHNLHFAFGELASSVQCEDVMIIYLSPTLCVGLNLAKRPHECQRVNKTDFQSSRLHTVMDFVLIGFKQKKPLNYSKAFSNIAI